MINTSKGLRSENVNIALVMLAAVLLNILGAIVAKYAALNISTLYVALPLSMVLLVIYLGRTVFWVLVGKKYQLSYIYPVLSINYFFSFLLGMYLFNEQFQLGRCLGAFIIVSGVLVISLSEHKFERSNP
jgi:multidrug transporter EmrE-like cation transporter